MESGPSNVDLTVNRDTEIHIVSLVFMFLTVLSVIGRLISLHIRRSPLATDDILIIIAFVSTFSLLARLVKLRTMAPSFSTLQNVSEHTLVSNRSVRRYWQALRGEI